MTDKNISHNDLKLSFKILSKHYNGNIKMLKLKQNLFLFLEEKPHKYDISSNLAILSMNTFVVDEDAQFEVVGVFYLKRATKEMVDLNNPEYKFFAT